MGEHADNEHGRLVEDRNGQVGYAPAALQQRNRKETLPRRDKGTVQRITGLEEGLDRRENEGRAIQRQ